MSKAGHNLLQIAQVLKSNGTDGELVMGFREMGPEEIDLNEPVFIILMDCRFLFYRIACPERQQESPCSPYGHMHKRRRRRTCRQSSPF